MTFHFYRTCQSEEIQAARRAPWSYFLALGSGVLGRAPTFVRAAKSRAFLSSILFFISAILTCWGTNGAGTMRGFASIWSNRQTASAYSVKESRFRLFGLAGATFCRRNGGHWLISKVSFVSYSLRLWRLRNIVRVRISYSSVLHSEEDFKILASSILTLAPSCMYIQRHNLL